VAAPAPAAQPDVFEQLRKLAELRDAGIVTAEEFDAKKAELLSRL
jgi:predicted Zn-dependent peptidase